MKDARRSLRGRRQDYLRREERDAISSTGRRTDAAYKDGNSFIL